MPVPCKLSGAEEAMPHQAACESTTLLKQVECLPDYLTAQPIIHLAEMQYYARQMYNLLKKGC